MSKTPGRKPALSPSRKKPELSSDAKVIYELYKKQPQTREELCKKTGISQSTFYRISSNLKEHKIIKCNDGLYSLLEFEFLEKQIEDAISKRLSPGKWIISFDVLANDVGKPTSEIYTLVYKVAKDLKFKVINHGTGKAVAKMGSSNTE